MIGNDQQNPLSVRTSGDTHAGSFIVPNIVTPTPRAAKNRETR